MTRAFVLSCLPLVIAHAAELKPETVAAFDRYVQASETRLDRRVKEGPFLGFADAPSAAQQLKSGVILVPPGQGNVIVPIDGGLIQDVNGAVFIPGATLKGTLAVVEDYNRHSQIYQPDIASSKLLSRTDNDFVVGMRIVKSKFRLSVVLNTIHKIHYTQLDAKRVYSRAYSTRIAEVRNAGESKEYELPVGQDHGLLWRLYGYWFFEEKDGGVYVECESITLTRDVPFLLSKIVGPVVRDLPAEALQATLRKTRAAATNRPEPRGQAAGTD